MKQSLVGSCFGKLFVISKTDLKYRNKETLYACQCDCRSLCVATSYQLKKRGKVDCGCGNKQRKSDGAKQHGLVVTNRKLYSVYKAMVQRCTNHKHPLYDDYGGRGISVCERWLDIHKFFEDMLPTYKEGLTLDRNDNNGGYSPENCLWRDAGWQAYNKRIKSTNTTGKTGVYWNKRKNLWETKISVNKEQIFLGYFSNYCDAVKAREEAELKYYGRLKGN